MPKPKIFKFKDKMVTIPQSELKRVVVEGYEMPEGVVARLKELDSKLSVAQLGAVFEQLAEYDMKGRDWIILRDEV